ncbi:MAG: asparagine synthase [Candidatus Competibacteraceae bacterium]|nr:asparagine synthase [Candidatus Competibacteraceae bacterium]
MACLFGYYGPPADGLLARMAALLAHRCPLGWEQVRDVTRTGDSVEIGHGRAAWNQPTQLAQRDHDLLGYGGVLFNQDRATPQDTEALPPAARLLTQLADAPEPCLEALTGCFVLAAQRGDMFYLLRDPAGVKVVYWTVCQGRLLFASEIKALFADPALARRMRPGALPEYLSFSFVPGAGTMFEGIEALQPGAILRFQRGQARTWRHFRCEDEAASVSSSACAVDYSAQVRAALEQSVAECLAVQPDKPPAVFLSGGIDSSAVLAVAAQQAPAVRLPTFSAHFGAEYARENEFIEQMVGRYHTDHHWLEIRPGGFLEQLREIIWRLDDPIGDPVTIPNYLLAQAASQVADVVLNGEGGDPCFGGPKNIPMLMARLYGPLPGEPATGWLERNYLRAFQRCYQDLSALLNPDLLREAGGEEALIALLEPYFRAPEPRDFVNKLMSINIRLKGANLILVKVEKMSAAHGLLALPPLFSRRIIETSMRCPPSVKLEGAVEKSVLKKAVQDCVPEAIIARPKSGMMVPVRFWFQGEMRRYGQKLLSRSQIRRGGLFNPDYVERLLNYEMEGVPGLRHGLKLWMLMTFLLWHEQMVETPIFPP